MRRKRITSEDLLSSLKTKDKTLFFDLQCHIMVEQNRRELATCYKSFISDGGLNPLVYVYRRMGQKGLDRLLSMPVTTDCLQRYRSSLVVVLCPLPAVIGEGSKKQQEQHQFVRDSFKLLSQCGISHVYMDVTGHQDQLSGLSGSSTQGKNPSSSRMFISRKAEAGGKDIASNTKGSKK